MRKCTSAALLAAVLLFDRSPVSAQERLSAGRRLTLRTYNYAEALPEVVASAKRRADRLLRDAAIETEWRDCPTSPERLATNRACRDPLGPTHVVLNLLPRSMSRKYGLRRGIFGFALPAPNGAPGNKISLFFGRVLDLAYYGEVGTSFENAQAIILGHMMAHEVGHLLLGVDSHSSSGVMGFPWDKRTLKIMERGRLRFSAAELKRMQRAVMRRASLRVE